jgi:hypothetical protein
VWADTLLPPLDDGRHGKESQAEPQERETKPGQEGGVRRNLHDGAGDGGPRQGPVGRLGGHLDQDEHPVSGAPRGSGSGKRNPNRDRSPRRDLRHHRARRRAHAASGERPDAHLVSLAVGAGEEHSDLALHVDEGHAVGILAACAALDLERHRRSGGGPDGEGQEGALALDGPIADGIGATPDGVLEEECQGVQPGPCFCAVEAQDDRGLSASRHPPDHPSLGMLAEELPNDIEGNGRLVPGIGDDHAHFESRRASHDLSRHLEGGPDTRGPEKQEKKKSGEATSWTEQT